MSIILSNNRIISDYRVKTMLGAKDKKEATQLRGIRGWLQNKLSPQSKLRCLFGVTKREQKLESVWNDLHKPQAKNATSNVDKIIIFHNLYSLMDEETKKNTVFKVDIANDELFGQELIFIINDQPIASFSHFAGDEKFISTCHNGVISSTSYGELLKERCDLTGNETMVMICELYLKLNESSRIEKDAKPCNAEDILGNLEKILKDEKYVTYIQQNTRNQIEKDMTQFLAIARSTNSPANEYGLESYSVATIKIAMFVKKQEDAVTIIQKTFRGYKTRNDNEELIIKRRENNEKLTISLKDKKIITEEMIKLNKL